MVKKDAQCSETYEKTFLFLFFLRKGFEKRFYFKCLGNLPKYHQTWSHLFCPKRCAMFCNLWKTYFRFLQFLVSRMWSILCSKLLDNTVLRLPQKCIHPRFYIYSSKVCFYCTTNSEPYTIKTNLGWINKNNNDLHYVRKTFRKFIDCTNDQNTLICNYALNLIGFNKIQKRYICVQPLPFVSN